MSGAGSLYELARSQTKDRLNQIRQQHGTVPAGIIADGWIRGTVDGLQEFLSPEDVYGVLQRHADGAADPLLLSKTNDLLKG